MPVIVTEPTKAEIDLDRRLRSPDDEVRKKAIEEKTSKIQIKKVEIGLRQVTAFDANPGRLAEQVREILERLTKIEQKVFNDKGETNADKGAKGNLERG